MKNLYLFVKDLQRSLKIKNTYTKIIGICFLCSIAACQETCKNKPGETSQPDSGSSTNSGGGNAGGGNAGGGNSGGGNSGGGNAGGGNSGGGNAGGGNAGGGNAGGGNAGGGNAGGGNAGGGNAGGGNAGGGNAGSTPPTGAPATVTDAMITEAENTGFNFLVYRLYKLKDGDGDSANINSKDAQGATAFHHAARLNDSVIGPQILGILRQAGATVEKDKAGNTPLHYASLAGTTFLLTNNLANVNEKNNKGETPLYVAAAAGKLSVVQYLLGHGADKTLQTGNKLSKPLDVVRAALGDLNLTPEQKGNYIAIRELLR